MSEVAVPSKVHVHGAHFLDADNLVPTAKRMLDIGDNRRLYGLCVSGDHDKVAFAFIKAFEEPIRRAGAKWPELSLSFPIPHVDALGMPVFQPLSERIHRWADLCSSGRYGFRIAGCPHDTDLHVLTMTLVKGSKWR